jgi:hypothetical protein
VTRRSLLPRTTSSNGWTIPAGWRLGRREARRPSFGTRHAAPPEEVWSMKPVRPPTRPPTDRRDRHCGGELSRSPRLRAACTQWLSRGPWRQPKLRSCWGFRRFGDGAARSAFRTRFSRDRPRTAHAAALRGAPIDSLTLIERTCAWANAYPGDAAAYAAVGDAEAQGLPSLWSREQRDSCSADPERFLERQ